MFTKSNALPPSRPAQVKVRALPKQSSLLARRLGADSTPQPSFRHAGRPVEPGEVVTCDSDLGAMLVELGRAERV